MAQYATPDQLLAAPANDFVADFVGHDRAVKRLRITPIDVDTLHRPPTAATVSDARSVLDAHQLVVVVGAEGDSRVDVLVRGNDGPTVVPVIARDRSLQDALALMLETHSAWVAVADGGRYLGLLGIDNLYNGDGRARE